MTFRASLIGVTAISVLLASASALSQSTVETGAYFYRYSGPVGHGIYNDGSGPIVDSSLTTIFRDVAFGDQVTAVPQAPHDGYDAPQFAGAGTATLFLPGIQSQGVDFWIREGAVDPIPNRLTITGHTTQGVTIPSGQSQSNVFKLATISFTNETWYGSTGIDPGNGPLYGESVFDFSIIAYPTPFIGNSGFPGYHVHNGSLFLHTTFGAGTPDYMYVNSITGLNVVAVDEGITGTVEVWGRIGSLDVTEFRNPSAGVQLLSSIPPPIPEPGVYAMLLAGLGLVGFAARRRNPA